MNLRQPREENPAYLAYVRTLPCVICARPGPNDPAHIRSAALQYGKRSTGMAEKPDDKWTLPLCRTHHEDQHRNNELDWWKRMGIDPFALAMSLYANCPVPNRPTTRRSKPVRERKPPEQRKKLPTGRKLVSRNTFKREEVK